MEHKLYVIEGLDGSGKATQATLLTDYLTGKGIPCRKLSFPDYNDPSSTLVKMYLHGEIGTLEEVNPYGASLFFTVDRYASYCRHWRPDYEAGKILVADRYSTSNAVHQASKLPPGERKAFLDWLFDTEYRLLGLPKPDLVIYLDMPTEITEKMMRRRETATGTHADIHEQDETYLKNCRAAAREIVKDCGWTVIRCARDGDPRTVEDIHNQVYRTVRKLL